MKKKVLLIILAAAVTAAVFVPIPQGTYDDGGTREYRALAYKIVDWKRLTADGTYEATKIYWFPDNFKSNGELWAQEWQNAEHSFVATVLEISSDSVLVQPIEGETELLSSDKIHINTVNLDDIGAQVGSEVEIHYTGGIMESYPAQIHADKWELASNLRHKAFIEQWLDKDIAPPYENGTLENLVITKIYSNCFFAVSAMPSPYIYKLNGALSEEWCPGDQITCTVKNGYHDAETHRIEADMLTVKASYWQPDPGMAYKPVLYLYPQQETDVSVKLKLNGKLTCTYPAYNTGWEVTAAPDGTLTDAKGQTYNYLYWEGETNARWDMTEGFCIKGEDTAAFLEQSLAKLGLNRREANEFIVYWLHLMEQNAYNIISFQTNIYTAAAELQVDPTPDTLIRIFMAWRAADTFVELPEQALTAPERSGFTVVEWGGSEVK